RHTAFQYRKLLQGGERLERLAELGVAYLIEGSVRRIAEQLRVNVQLIETATNAHVWAEKYDTPLAAVYRIQDEITETAVSTLSGQIRRIETARAQSRSSPDLTAYDHLLRGLSYHKNGNVSRENFARARDEFEKAIALDPQFARPSAWVICARAGAWEVRSLERIDASIAEARRVLALDEQESESHRMLGSLYLFRRDYALAGHHFSEALRLSPNDAHIRMKMARYLSLPVNWTVRRPLFIIPCA
ncbi:MAG: hypothetical protein R3E89_15250, partial [Thiolinea sp.]